LKNFEIKEEKMSQKTDTDILGGIFNLAQFHKVQYYDNPREEDYENSEKKESEDLTYTNIVEGLESDLRNLGAEVTYSSKILIGEIAMNLLFLQRVKRHMLCRDLLFEEEVLKHSRSSIKKDGSYSHKKTESVSKEYDYYPSHKLAVHPLFDKLVPQLQKQINAGLKALGLLPSQQAERKKLVIVQKLREKCEQLDREYTVRAEAEKTHLKKVPITN
jgi:hypothetical protein